MHASCGQEILDLLDDTPIGGRERQYQVVRSYCELAVERAAEPTGEALPPDETTEDTSTLVDPLTEPAPVPSLNDPPSNDPTSAPPE